MPVTDQTPNVILIDSSENLMEVSGGNAVSTGTKGILFTGIQSNGTASFLLADSGGRLTITGSVTVPNTLTVTGSLGLTGTSTITGSVGITNFPVSQSVTGTVGISGITTITGSTSILNTVTITGSVTIANTTFAGTGSTSPITGALVGGKDNSGNFSPFSLDASRNLLVTGTISVANTPTVTGSVTVNGLVFASGALAVFVSGTNTQTVTGTITVNNLAFASGALAVFVSGTNTQQVTGSVITVSQDTSSTSTALGALDAAVTLNLSGTQGAAFQLAAGTLVGTLTAESSVDGGTTWNAVDFFDIASSGITPSIVFAASNAAIAKAILLTQGGGQVRVRVSAYTSGTANAILRVGFTPPLVRINSPVDGVRQTYSGATASFATAATPTDIFVIGGSATKTIRVLRIEFHATQTTASGGILVQLIKRSTANTVGTAVTTTKVPYDSLSAAATALVQHYTANPTVGSTVGSVRAAKVLIPAPATTAVIQPLAVWDFGTRPGQAIVLRGTAQQLAINLNSVTLTGGAVAINVEWTEE